MSNREQTLENLKVLVLALRNQASEMEANPELIARWQKKAEKVKKELKDLSVDDIAWFEDQYYEWLMGKFEAEIENIRLTFG